MIFQEPMTSLSPVHTVGNQIMEALTLHTNLGKTEARLQVIDMMQRVGIPNPVERFNQYPHQMSGGLRQRTIIAMALVCQPKLLIADEPTTALDVTIQAQIIDLLRKLNEKRGLSILFISHDLSLVKSFAHRTMVMYAGRIVESAPTDIIFSQPKHPYTKSLLQVASLAKENDSFITINGSVPDPRHYPSGCPFYPRCDVVEDVCSNAFPKMISDQNHYWNCILE